MKLRCCALFMLCALSLLPAAAFAAGPEAAGAAAPMATTLKLDAGPRMDKGVRVKGQLILSATLTSADGKPLSDRSVTYYQAVDLFGSRDALLGSATTDSTGNATLLFIPAQPGSTKLKARFEGNPQFKRAEAEEVEQVSDAVVPFRQQAPPLAVVATWASYGVGVLAFAAWAVLLGVLLRTAVGIRRAASPAVHGGR